MCDNNNNNNNNNNNYNNNKGEKTFKRIFIMFNLCTLKLFQRYLQIILKIVFQLVISCKRIDSYVHFVQCIII